METLYADQEQFGRKGSLRTSVEETQRALDFLENARKTLASGPSSTPIVLAKLSNPVKQSLDAINVNLKDVHKASTTYAKAIDRRFRQRNGPAPEDGRLSNDALLDRAIGMHLLREGEFNVATAFFEEVPNYVRAFGTESGGSSGTPQALKTAFEQMYHILQEMRFAHNLGPAMEWAHSRSRVLQERGSDLEFDLTKLRFISLFASPVESSTDLSTRRLTAVMYARDALSRFEGRYLREIEKLLSAITFLSNIEESPYNATFRSTGTWEDVALSFTREFCSLLGLSADSPLFIAATAGAMALPRLEKLQTIMKEKRTEWTTAHELPVEIPLPPSYRFHSIFVCPVSKEQTTDSNPPMLLPCCHIIAQDSLQKISKLGKFKCPYCPEEAQSNLAQKVIL